MTTEEKAKIYDSLVESLETIIKARKKIGQSSIKIEDIEKLLPEKNSDEDIRKEIVSILKSSMGETFSPEKKKRCLDWVYKAVIPEKTNTSESIFNVGDIVRLKEGNGREWKIDKVCKDGYYSISSGKDDDFIKLDDSWEKVVKRKLKFKVGDWLTTNINGITYHVVGVDNGNYTLENSDVTCNYECELIDNNARLWSVDDIKEGDRIYYILDGEKGLGVVLNLLDNGTSLKIYSLLENGELVTRTFDKFSAYIRPCTKIEADRLIKIAESFLDDRKEDSDIVFTDSEEDARQPFIISSEEIDKAEVEAYNNALDKNEYSGDSPSYCDGFHDAIRFLMNKGVLWQTA